MTALLGLQTDDILNGFVTGNLIGADLSQTERLWGSDNGGDILVDGQLLHLIVGLLGKGNSSNQGANN